MLVCVEHGFCKSDKIVMYEKKQRMVVKLKPGLVRPRIVSVVNGVTDAERKLGVNGRSIQTLAVAIDGRVMQYCDGTQVLQSLPCARGAVKELGLVRTRIIGIFGRKPTPMTRQEFVECYKGRRRTIYQNALETLESRPVERKDSFISAFVKCEKINTTKTPRVIQPRNPRYNVEVGRYIKHVEHRLYKCLARLFGQRVVVAKGLNVECLGREIESMWEAISDPVFIGFDANRFDMHVNVDILKWEHSIYTGLYPGDAELESLLRWQLRTRGFAYSDDGQLKYWSVGHRASGDMNTGLGNCLIMCALMYLLRKELDIPFKGINNGDDCGIIVSKIHVARVLRAVTPHFMRFGFRVTCEEPVYELENITFCGMQPIRCSRGVVMVRTLRTALEKDSISITKLINEKMMRKWLYSVGECGLSLCGGIPVMQAFYTAYMRNGLPSNMSDALYMECGARILANGIAPKTYPISAESRESFWLAFGLLPDEQIDLEQYFETWSCTYGDIGAFLSDVEPMGNYTIY